MRHRAGRDGQNRPSAADAGAGILGLREHDDVELTAAAPCCPPRASAKGEQLLVRLIAPLRGETAARRIVPRLIASFGSLPRLLGADRAAIAAYLADDQSLVELLLAVRPLIDELLRAELLSRPVLPDTRAVLDYLFVSMAHEPAEQVRVLYLDAKNRLLAEELAGRGTITRVDIFPREIVRRALALGATGLIMTHNHPSGDPEPSRSDLEATRAVAEAARLFEIRLHDHIIIGRSGFRSLRGDGYL